MSIENAHKKLINLRAELESDMADYPMVALGVLTKLTQCINTLSFVGNLAVSPMEKVELPPITSFMGEPLTQVEEVTEETLTPQEIDRNNLIAKIDVLESTLDTATNDQILETYRLDSNVIRGLAKRAGLEDFRTAEITEPYVQLVRESIAEKNASDKATQDFEESL